MTLDNYIGLDLNRTNTALYAAVGSLIFIVLTSYPVEFWRKTPYMLGNILSIYLFHSILLCPNRYGLVESNSLNQTGWMTATIYTYLVMQYF